MSTLKDAAGMFKNCLNLTDAEIGDLSSWKNSPFTRILNMFAGCGSVTSLNLSGWDVTKVSYLDELFASCYNLTSVDMSGWQVKPVTVDSAFEMCFNLPSVDISGWNSSRLYSIDELFAFCPKLTSITVANDFSVAKVGRAGELFLGDPLDIVIRKKNDEIWNYDFAYKSDYDSYEEAEEDGDTYTYFLDLTLANLKPTDGSDILDLHNCNLTYAIHRSNMSWEFMSKLIQMYDDISSAYELVKASVVKSLKDTLDSNGMSISDIRNLTIAHKDMFSSRPAGQALVAVAEDTTKSDDEFLNAYAEYTLSTEMRSLGTPVYSLQKRIDAIRAAVTLDALCTTFNFISENVEGIYAPYKTQATIPGSFTDEYGDCSLVLTDTGEPWYLHTTDKYIPAGYYTALSDIPSGTETAVLVSGAYIDHTKEDSKVYVYTCAPASINPTSFVKKTKFYQDDDIAVIVKPIADYDHVDVIFPIEWVTAYPATMTYTGELYYTHSTIRSYTDIGHEAATPVFGIITLEPADGRYGGVVGTKIPIGNIAEGGETRDIIVRFYKDDTEYKEVVVTVNISDRVKNGGDRTYIVPSPAPGH